MSTRTELLLAAVLLELRIMNGRADPGMYEDGARLWNRLTDEDGRLTDDAVCDTLESGTAKL